MNKPQVDELLLQSLEQEIGGIKVYETALTHQSISKATNMELSATTVI